MAALSGLLRNETNHTLGMRTDRDLTGAGQTTRTTRAASGYVIMECVAGYGADEGVPALDR